MWGFYNSVSKFEEFMKQKEQEQLIAEIVRDLRIKEHSYLSVSEIILEDFGDRFPSLSPSTESGRYICEWSYKILMRKVLR